MKRLGKPSEATVLVVAAMVVFLWTAPRTAEATHFRNGHYFWSQAGGNTIEVTVQDAFRRNGYSCIDPATLAVTPCSPGDGLPQVGDVIDEFIGFTVFNWGDGASVGSPLGPLLYRVNSIDPANNWLFSLALDPASLPAIDTTLSHTYAAAGNYTAFTDSCCRISGVAGVNEHINNPDGNYRVETIVNVGSSNNSPVSAMPPIVLCPINALCTFLVPGADPDGDLLKFRLSTSAEAGGFTQPGPPYAPNAASIDSTTGLYSWDTAGATLAADPTHNTLYSTQVTIEDPTSKVAVDFLIQLVKEDPNQPVIAPPVGSPPICETTQVVTVGNTKTFDVVASDPDVDDIVTLNVVGLPLGATMTPSLPIAGNPVSSMFSWTPGPGDVGVHVINFTASSSAGGFALCPVTIEVIRNTPPDCSRAAASLRELWPPNHQFLDVTVQGVTDPDGDPLTITVTRVTQDEPLNGLGDGNTCPDAGGVGTAMAMLRAERTGTPRVPGDGRVYHVSFTANDGKGGECRGRVRVCVPHDQRPGHVCVDQGPLFDSTRCP